jgi:Rieske Fe-S protein
MTHGTIAGMLLSDLVMGRENPWAEAYDPSRKPVKGLPDYLRENVNVAVQYTDWLTRGDVSSVEEIPPGGGAILRDGASKQAIYRADDGQLHARSAVCTHLGCVVQWNKAEKSWDCPCHGSRFDARGKVFHGPATKDLEPVEIRKIA